MVVFYVICPKFIEEYFEVMLIVDD